MLVTDQKSDGCVGGASEERGLCRWKVQRTSNRLSKQAI